MQIIVHKGTHQIGGSVTEIRTATARIIIDMGADLPTADKKENTELNIEGVTIGKPNCDAVLITHYHGDHIGMIEKVLPGIPIYMGDIAKKIYLTVQQTIKDKLGKGNPELVETLKTMKPGKIFSIKDITITPLCVDHSAFDAYALLIEAGNKRILHTGDFRMHGARGKSMPRIFKTYANNLDVLITEGTMISRSCEKPLTEHELCAKAKELMREHKSTFVLCSSTNIDSVAAFYNAAIECRRPFIVCDFMQVDILRLTTENSTSPFYDFTKKKVYTYAKNLHDMMDDLGFCMIARVNYATETAIKTFPQNLLIYSMWNGYLEEHRPAYDERKAKFVKDAVAAGSKFENLHTSGHATIDDIKKLCEITMPKTIIPIHCENPDSFKSLGISGEIQVLCDGESTIV